MELIGPMPSRVRLALGVLAFLTVAYTAQVTFILVPRPGSGALAKVATNVIVLGAALLCAWRAAAVREERAAWLERARRFPRPADALAQDAASEGV